MKESSQKTHVPVMVQECLDFFKGKEIRTFFEGTLGAGGHARAILEAHPEIECYIGCDQDSQAIEIAKKNLKTWESKVKFVHSNFLNLEKILEEKKIDQVDGFFLTWGSLLCS